MTSCPRKELKVEKIRLSKYFTDCGIMSRRHAEQEISAGRVKVNGEIAIIGQKVDPDCDVVEYGGKIIRPRIEENVCVMLNKPRGIVCTASDEKGRANVTSLCHDLKDKAGKPLRLYPIGRLDMDSDGLLLLTNDGTLSNMLTHPKHSIPKIYHVTVKGTLTDSQALSLGEPIEIDGRMTSAVRPRIISRNDGNTIIEFILYEGRNRQIRRMCDSHGVKISKLTRVAIGELSLGDLQVGKWRLLTYDEINYLKSNQ